jgi:hypothetical protein
VVSLRLLTLKELVRTQSPRDLERDTDASIRSRTPSPAAGPRWRRWQRRTGCSARSGGVPSNLSLRLPKGSAPRLYVESLNEMIDMQTVQVSPLADRVPYAVLMTATLAVLGGSSG